MKPDRSWTSSTWPQSARPIRADSGVYIGACMRIEALFPNINKIDSLFLALPPGSREGAEAAAATAVADFRQTVDWAPSFDTVREVSTLAMFDYAIGICPNQQLRLACREAFGITSERFMPGAT